MGPSKESRKTKLIKRILEEDGNNGRQIESECYLFLKRHLMPCDAEDVLQSSYLDAIQYARTYDEKRPFMPWFFRIVQNSCKDFLRTAKKKREISLSEFFKEPGSADGEYLMDEAILDKNNNPEQISSKDEIADLTKRMLFKYLPLLKRKYSSILIKRYYQELQYSEIAIAENITIGTVKSRLNSAKKALEGLISRESEALTRILE